MASIPPFGEVGLQYPTVNGVCNVSFPVTMTTYPYLEAPPLPGNNLYGVTENVNPTRSTVTLDTDGAEGYDTDVVQEAFQWQIEAERELNGIWQPVSDSDSDYDSEGNFWRRQDSCFSIESDSSGHWY